jgi:hypothetical protein
MVKSRKNKSSIINTIKKTSEKALPVLDKNITKVGVAAKEITEKSIPVVEKGVTAVYGTMATGFDLGVKGAKIAASGIKNVSRKKRTKSHRNKKSKRSYKKTRK